MGKETGGGALIGVRTIVTNERKVSNYFLVCVGGGGRIVFKRCKILFERPLKLTKKCDLFFSMQKAALECGFFFLQTVYI